MDRFITEDGKQRELVKIACPVTEGNDQGFRIGYRDAMAEGDVLFEEPEGEESTGEETEVKRGPGRPRK